MASLCLPPDCRDNLARWASCDYPNESCGLLLGQRDQQRQAIKRVTHAQNLSPERSRDRYLLDPKHILDTDDAARREGVEIIGVWHSHPDHPARPSETDRSAAWPGWSYLIVSVSSTGVDDFRSWRLDPHQVFEEEVICDE